MDVQCHMAQATPALLSAGRWLADSISGETLFPLQPDHPTFRAASDALGRLTYLHNKVRTAAVQPSLTAPHAAWYRICDARSVTPACLGHPMHACTSKE